MVVMYDDDMWFVNQINLFTITRQVDNSEQVDLVGMVGVAVGRL